MLTKLRTKKFGLTLAVIVGLLLIPFLTIKTNCSGTGSDAPESYTLGDTPESSTVSQEERDQVTTEFPQYSARKKEQTYLTLSEWYQVYNYNEFGTFLQSGGKQTDFPFLASLKNFWCYYDIALRESSGEPFNWQYNFVTWVIGGNMTLEYAIKAAYENSIGAVTQLLAGSDTEVDRYIANSWNSYAERMYQTTWYHYPYFTDVKGIWIQTPLFDKHFVRNLERKLAFSLAYLIKGSYGKLWLLTAVQKENKTLSIVQTKNRPPIEQEKIALLKTVKEDTYLIETERYAGFKEALLQLLAEDVRFIEIQGHNSIALSYLSKNGATEFLKDTPVRILDVRPLFFHPENYTHRVTLAAKVPGLKAVLTTITTNGDRFEMIYDF